MMAEHRQRRRTTVQRVDDAPAAARDVEIAPDGDEPVWARLS